MLDGEDGGALEECRRRRVAASVSRSLGRLLQLAGDGFVRSRRRHRKVPGGAVGGRRGVHLPRQRTMHRAAFRGGQPIVGERAHQRMAELHDVAEPDEAIKLRLDAVDVDSQPLHHRQRDLF